MRNFSGYIEIIFETKFLHSIGPRIKFCAMMGMNAVREFPAFCEFVTILTNADQKTWCFCTQGLGILIPDYEVLAKDMNLSSAQEFIDTHPGVFSKRGPVFLFKMT